MKFKVEPHSFIGKISSYVYCSGCGLIRMRNPFTDWCVKQGCGYRDHPSYASMRRRLTGPSWRSK